MIVVGIAVEGELQHLHARISRLFQHFPHPLVYDPQVLRDDGTAFPALEQRRARSLQPFALLRVRRPRGDRVKAVEAAEMIDTKDIEQRQGIIDARVPPGVTVSFQLFPIIDGIAPQLTVGGKGVGRHPRHGGGSAFSSSKNSSPRYFHISTLSDAT